MREPSGNVFPLSKKKELFGNVYCEIPPRKIKK